MTKNILFICGSYNQTTQMHQIAQHMGEYNCYFTPYYADGVERLIAKTGLLDSSVLGGSHQRATRQYFTDHQLLVDERGEGREYDLVFICSDLIVQRNIRRKRLVLVQEGITEPEGLLYHLYKTLPFLPRYMANTATMGLSDAYDLFCVGSEGYAEHFIRKGVRREKIAVTGIPNFDNLQKHRDNTFPYRNHVLVATTPHRESLRHDDRRGFLIRCREIAAGRLVIFKLHPAENVTRAKREIKEYFPGAIVYRYGNVHDMIANAKVVITQRSSCTFTAVALGKETYTDLDLEELRRLMPIQNIGTSARHIASLSLRVLHTPFLVLEQIRKGVRPHPGWGPIKPDSQALTKS
jgi:hypothetical protein